MCDVQILCRSRFQQLIEIIRVLVHCRCDPSPPSPLCHPLSFSFSLKVRVSKYKKPRQYSAYSRHLRTSSLYRYKSSLESEEEMVPSTVACCSVFECVAVCCSVVQCVAACCRRRSIIESREEREGDGAGLVVLQCVAACCSLLQNSLYHRVRRRGRRRWYEAGGVEACCSVLLCVAVCCSVLQCVAEFASS